MSRPEGRCHWEVVKFYAQVTDEHEAELLSAEVCSICESITTELHSRRDAKRQRRAFQKHLTKCRELLPCFVAPETLASRVAALDSLADAANEYVAVSRNRCPYDPAIAVAIRNYIRLYPARRLATTRGVRNRLRLHLMVLRDLVLPLAPGFPEKISERHLKDLIAKSSKFEASNLETPNL